MTDPRAAVFDEHRRHLLGIAYRMLGSYAEAEDVVQDAWLRFRDVDLGTLDAPRAWLARTTTRLALDVLKSARHRRESYVGPWLPEPVRTEAPVDRDSLSMAFLVLLESLSPTERAAFLLCEVFDYSHAEAGAMLEISEGACRQLLHRARGHVHARRPRFQATRETHTRLLGAFLGALQTGDLDGLRALLHDDVVTRSDSGGKARAARNLVVGADHVARLWMGLFKKLTLGPDVRAELLEVNGQPAVVLFHLARATQALLLEVEGERIVALDLVVNPDKLARLTIPVDV